MRRGGVWVGTRLRELARWLAPWVRPARRHLIALGIALAVALVLAGLRLLGVGVALPLASRDDCSVSLSGATYSLSRDQAAQAGKIAVAAVRRGLPARAVSVVLDVELTDHDLGRTAASSLGDYDRLVEIGGYRTLPFTTVAHRVGGSSADDYQDAEPEARALASALTGNSSEAFRCVVRGRPAAASDALDSRGLVARAQRVLDDVEGSYGEVPYGGFAPGGVHAGHMPGSAHYEGRAVDFFFRPITPANNIRGWALAQYLVSQASRLDIATVIYDDRIWTAARSTEGWRDYHVPAGTSGDLAILEHRDHVHADVFD